MWPGAYARQMYLSAVASRLRVYQTLRVDDSTLLLYLCPFLRSCSLLRSFAAGPSNAAFVKAVAASSHLLCSLTLAAFHPYPPARLSCASSFLCLAFGSKAAFLSAPSREIRLSHCYPTSKEAGLAPCRPQPPDRVPCRRGWCRHSYLLPLTAVGRDPDFVCFPLIFFSH